MYTPGTDPTLRAVKVPEAWVPRLKENEAIWKYKYVDELCSELVLDVLGGNPRTVKCQRRALTSGLQSAEEAIIQVAKAHKWTKAAPEQALNDLRGLVLPKKEKADKFLKEVGQREKCHWMDNCQKMAQNAISLASQAMRILTIIHWSPQDCEEFLEDKDKDFRKTRKAWAPIRCRNVTQQ